MTACLHHRDLCDAHQQTGHNQHRCFLDPGHDGAHRCVCWHVWIVERGRDPRIIMLHCGHCGHIKRGVDSTRDRAVGDALITLICREQCPHPAAEVQP